MSIGLGIGVQRPKQLRSIYSVNGKVPGFTADFIKNYYPGHTSLSSAITHARAGNATMTDGYGPELVTNGDFLSNIDDWSVSNGTASWVGGQLLLNETGSDGVTARAYQTISTVVGTTYWVTARVGDVSTGTGIVAASNSTSIGGKPQQNSSGNATVSFAFVAEATTTYIVLAVSGTTARTVYFDNVSVREMPVIKWAPHNLLTYSETFDSSDWTYARLTDSVGVTAPDGSSNSTALTLDATTNTHYVQQSITASGSSYTGVVYLKTNGVQYAGITLQASTTYGCVADLVNGTITQSGSNTASTSIEDVGDGWYKIQVKIDAAATQLLIGLSNSSSSLLPSFAGDGSSGIYAWGAHLYRSDLGGMVDNPDRGDSYVPTAGRPFGANLVTNGTFDTDSNWDEVTTGFWSISGGTATMSQTSTFAPLYQELSISVGKTYTVSFDVTGFTGTSMKVGFTTANGMDEIGQFTSNGSYTFTKKAVNANRLGIGFARAVDAGCNIDNVTVRESSVDPATARYLPRIGHHVYNGSAWANEGVLAESEARTNLLTQSTMKDVNYTKTRAEITDNQIISPDGTQNASKVNETTGTSGQHFIYRQDVSYTSGNDYTFSVFAKADTTTVVQLLGTSSVFGSAVYANFDIENGTIGSQGALVVNSSIQDVGNGWYRLSVTGTATTTAASTSSLIIAFTNNNTAAARAPSYVGDTAQQFYVFGGQVEQASTPSSLIPTSGSTVSRAAETFTIPSANLPWPTPQYIGSELVTNGDFSSTDISDWTTQGNATLSVTNGELVVSGDGGYNDLGFYTLSTTANKVYAVTITGRSITGSLRVQARLAGSPYTVLDSHTFSSTDAETVTLYFVAQASSTSLQIVQWSGSAGSGAVDNISVREINPLSVSIGMEGRVTYADEDDTQQHYLVSWFADASNMIRTWIDTTQGTGAFDFRQSEGGTTDIVTSGVNTLAPDVLVPYSISQRHGSTFVNGAVDGVALTANTTPTALPDLSSTDLELAYDYNGTISSFRVWDRDITDDGLVEATSPSLEPSLSLTFEGAGTNSFIVNDWS